MEEELSAPGTTTSSSATAMVSFTRTSVDMRGEIVFETYARAKKERRKKKLT